MAFDRETLEIFKHFQIDPATVPQKPKKKKKRNLAGPLTKACLQFLALNGCVCTRLNSGMARAMHGQGFVKLADKDWPDIVGLRLSDGKFIGIEIKAGHDVLSEGQSFWLDRAKKSGAICGVARSVDDVKKLLEK